MSDMQMSDAGDLDLEQECTSPLVQECEVQRTVALGVLARFKYISCQIYGGKQLSDDELLHLVVQVCGFYVFIESVIPNIKNVLHRRWTRCGRN